MAANRKEIVQRINEGFAENNLEKVLSFCTDDVDLDDGGRYDREGQGSHPQMDGVDES